MSSEKRKPVFVRPLPVLLWPVPLQPLPVDNMKPAMIPTKGGILAGFAWFKYSFAYIH